MAVDRDHDFFNPAHLLPQRLDGAREFIRDGIAHGIGNIDHGCAGPDSGFHCLAKELNVGAGSVFRRKLHVVAKRSRAPNRVMNLIERLRPTDLEFVFQMQI